MILWCSLAFAGETLLQRWDLEDGDGGFVVTGDTLQWEWGVVIHGPGGGFDGFHAWSTRLMGDYLNDTVDALEIPMASLASIHQPMLRFSSFYEVIDGDAGWIEVDDGTGWRRVVPVYGYPVEAGFVGSPGSWNSVVVDLKDAGPDPKVRLVFSSDVSGGSSGWTVDNVEVWDGDVAPPRVLAVEAPGDTEDLEGPYVVRATLEDNDHVEGAWVKWNDGTVEHQTEMLPETDREWKAELPKVPPGTTITGTVLASDGNAQTVSEPFRFRVYLAAPTELQCPAGRIIATTADLSWQAPASIHAVLGYSVYRDATVQVSSTQTSASVPLTGENDIFSVRAVYAEGEGDASASCAVDALVPQVRSLEPSSAWPGDEVTLRLSGRWLFLVDGEVQADLGAGIQVQEVAVEDVDTARLHLRIDADAVPGDRDLSLSTSQAALELPGAFQVESSSDRPRIRSVTPSEVRQGDQVTLYLTLVGELSAVPVADLGEGVVVEEVTLEDGGVALKVVVSPDAPLGEHPLRLDDGVRIFGGQRVEVKDRLVSPNKVCGTVDGALWLAVAGVFTIRRRRR